MNTLETTIRYAVTHVGRSGLRKITNATLRDSPIHARTLLRQIDPERKSGLQQDFQLEEYGPQAIGTFDVRPIECDEDGKPLGILAAE